MRPCSETRTDGAHCFANLSELSTRYIIVVEHDLSVLDYLSDFICCLYGVPSAYGVVTMPFSVREGSTRIFLGRGWKRESNGLITLV